MSAINEIIKNIRKTFLTLVEENEDLYHRNDVQLVKTNDWWIERFVLVKKSEESALRALVKAMKWRKSFGVNDFTADYFPEEVYKIGLFNTTSIRDKEGRRVLWYITGNNKKSKELRQMIREFVVYCFEKLDKQTTHEGWAFIGDTSDCNILNFEIDFNLFLVDVLQNYYPRGPKYILVIDLPLVLKATTDLINTFMNKEFRNHFKYIKNNELTNYLDIDSIPVHLNGENRKSLIEIPAGAKTLAQFIRIKFTNEQIDNIYKTFSKLNLS